MTTKYKLVPVEPTEEMIEAGWAAVEANRHATVAGYLFLKAGIAAVPELEGETPETDGVVVSLKYGDHYRDVERLLLHARKLELERNTLLAKLNELLDGETL